MSIMTKFLTIDDFDLEGKTVLVRVDFNSPVDQEKKRILDYTRIREHLQTIRELSDKGSRVVILSHQGRPGDPDFISLRQHAEILGRMLGRSVEYVDDLFEEEAKRAIRELLDGEILVLKNVRTHPSEMERGTPEDHAKTEMVRNLAPLVDIFMNDAFSTAHRAHASMMGFTAVLPSAAGRVMERESTNLIQVLSNLEKPCIFVLGGAKVDTRAKVSQYVLKNEIANFIFTGGITGQLFLVAEGYDLGTPNIELLKKKGLMSLVPGIEELIGSYPERVKTPIDLAISVDEDRSEIPVDMLPSHHPILDIGTKTVEEYSPLMREAKTIVVSGPLGVYEREGFKLGTRRVFEAVASSKAFSIVGGGHTMGALKEFGLTDKMGYTTIAGGAFLELSMDEKLPGVTALEAATRRLRLARSI
jgi:phosphoglycerate kinase